MKSTDRGILLIVPLLVALVGVWLLAIGPKRNEANELGAQAVELEAVLSAAEATVAVGEQARTSFRRDYADLVGLGAAAPEDGGQATLIYDISNLGQDNNVNFRSFSVTQVSTEATAPVPTAAIPTEAAVATLPIGAAIGPAGLPMMPYDFQFLGNFFNVADLFADIDDQVVVSSEEAPPEVRGRLLTINGFALTAHPARGFPGVQADFAVSTYAVPPQQGIDGGATPESPAAVVVTDPVAPVPPATAVPPATPAATVTP